MPYIQSVILGFIQGTTEFLPISSSAHLVLVPWIFGWDYMGLGFDTALHFGTAIAIVAFFWRDWASIITRAISRKKQDTRNPSTSLGTGKLQTNSKSQIPNSNEVPTKQGLPGSRFEGIGTNQAIHYPANLLWQILVASIPAAIAGYLLSDYVETYLHSPILLAINLAVFGIILWLVDIYANRQFPSRHPEHIRQTQCKLREGSQSAGDSSAKPQNDRQLSLNKINYKQSLIVGLSQCLALVPGVSRSGITMTAARGLGLNRENSARFSFILSAPATVGAFLFEARKVDWAQTTLPFWLAIIVTVIVGLLTIKYLLKYLQRGSFAIFTIYRIALAIIIVVLFLAR